MLNEWTYCERLGVLEWVHGEWRESGDTIDGAAGHRRVDRPDAEMPEAEAVDEALDLKTRSVWLTAEREGLTARIDLVELAEGLAAPVDYKKGHAPAGSPGAWEPDRVQLCAQALVLREAGYRVEHGIVVYLASKRRVEIDIDDRLVAVTRERIATFRAVAAAGVLPAPLRDSPKCPRCSLVAICLPDETALLADATATDHASGDEHHASAPAVGTGAIELRQVLAPRLEGFPLYVTEQGARVGLSKGSFEVTGRDGAQLASVRTRDTSQISLFGNAQITTQAMREAMDGGIAVCYHSFGGWFVGMAWGHHHKNVVLRRAQYAVAEDWQRSLAVARQIVRGKIRGQRTLLRRNHTAPDRAVLRELARLAAAAGGAAGLETLLGIEGAAGRLYFGHFGGMVKADWAESFQLSGRNRRPPRDPVNALLSYAYGMLARDCTVAAQSVGFDPYLGVYHQPRYGRPALALDLMEEFRSVVADSVVLTAINNGEVTPASFVRAANGCNLTQSGRKAFLGTYERRMDTLLLHPLFGYRASWRRIIEVQARLLGRHMMGELPRYVPIVTR
ncbi:MAG: CRISPR-associated endonuclease Cas1 [Candidatus Schekmanbacteria bacterium]|nr:CRISPR-associated endonuclease Cas1 [Candidatus Schekmanbacteria bacterium]